MKRYNNEQKQWLKQNINEYNNTVDFANNFNQKFNMNIKPHSLICYCNRIGLKSGKRKIEHYTEEQKQWLKNNYYNLSKSQLTNSFNQEFNTNVKVNTLISYCTRFLNVNKKEYAIRKNVIFYDKEKITWLKNNYDKYLFRKDLTNAFNKRFHTNLKSVGGIITRLGLKGKDKKLIARLIGNNCISGDIFQKKAIEYFKLELEIENLMS